MNGDSWNIQKAEGGFIVSISKQTEQSPNASVGGVYTIRVFIDSSSLINFLHNELVGSN